MYKWWTQCKWWTHYWTRTRHGGYDPILQSHSKWQQIFLIAFESFPKITFFVVIFWASLVRRTRKATVEFKTGGMWFVGTNSKSAPPSELRTSTLQAKTLKTKTGRENMRQCGRNERNPPKKVSTDLNRNNKNFNRKKLGNQQIAAVCALGMWAWRSQWC